MSMCHCGKCSKAQHEGGGVEFPCEHEIELQSESVICRLLTRQRRLGRACAKAPRQEGLRYVYRTNRKPM